MQLSYGGGFWSRLQVWLVALMIFFLLPVVAVAGDVAGSGNYKAGEDLFTGARAFSNGGPPCISCHDAGIGTLGGGTLGPDLTTVWKDKSFFINAAWINGETVPVMGPIFSKKNITPEEVEDLKAFFSVRATKAAKSGTGTQVISGIVLFVIFIIIIAIAWSGRYRNRNKGTAHDALWRNYGGKGGR